MYLQEMIFRFKNHCQDVITIWNLHVANYVAIRRRKNHRLFMSLDSCFLFQTRSFITRLVIFVLLAAFFSIASSGYAGYSCTVYGDWIGGSPHIVQNGSAYGGGFVGDTGYQEAEAKLLDSQPVYTMAGQIQLYGQDGEDDMPPDYPQYSCGQAYGQIIGSYIPSKYPAGTSLFLDLSITPSGSRIGDAEDFYLKVLNGPSVLTELTPQ